MMSHRSCRHFLCDVMRRSSDSVKRFLSAMPCRRSERDNTVDYVEALRHVNGIDGDHAYLEKSPESVR